MKNEIILCFGYAPYWGYWRQDHEIMQHISKNNLVIYIENQLGYLDYKRTGKSVWTGIMRIEEPRWINPGLVVYSAPPRLPRSILFNSEGIKNKIAYRSIITSKKLLEFKVKKILNKLALNPTMFWCFEPFNLPLVGHFGEQISCYRVFDEVSLFPGCTPIRKSVECLEKNYIKNVDFVFTSSSFQFEKRKDLNPNTFFIPNACNFRHYNRVLNENLPIPQDIKDISNPIIGFIGKIDNRMDIELINLLSNSHPEWSFVFVGWGEKTLIDEIQAINRGNIFFLGEKKVDILPNYLKVMDVSIIPYIISESTKTMYPWKLYEHLAAGKPIVSTALPEVEPFGELIRIAKSKNEFLEYIEEELVANSNVEISKRVEMAKNNTWMHRIKEMEKIIEDKSKIVLR